MRPSTRKMVMILRKQRLWTYALLWTASNMCWIERTTRVDAFSAPRITPIAFPARSAYVKPHSRRLLASFVEDTSADEETNRIKIEKHDVRGEKDKVKASKRDMLGFAIPALGIFLSNPLLSNIDNAFVGRTVGTAGLAALSPATICTDQMLYLFSFLGRATTGIVSRAYGGPKKDTDAVREAASAPLTVSLICGAAVSLLYVFFTSNMLSTLKVDSALRPAASSYIHWRGAIAWAALAQNVCLSVMLATRDAITPLKIIGLAAIVNILGDALFVRGWGCAGAAAATSFATLVSCGFMLKALAQKHILPRIKMPNRKEMLGLLEFTGPLLAITLTRLGGFIAMQRTAMKFGVQSLAGYQLCINLMIFFLLFGEPLSQLSQTKLPTLLDEKDGRTVLATLKSVLTLAAFTSIGIAGVSYAAARFGAGTFSSDLAVQSVAKETAPALFISVATAIFTVAVDGAMLASRDFGFMLFWGFGTFLTQLHLLKYCASVSDIFGTFTFRLVTYAVAAMARAAFGYGGLGRVIRSRRPSDADVVRVSVSQ